MLTEADIRLEIDEALQNKGWKLTGRGKNVFAEKNNESGRADYVLHPRDREHPLIVIEAKKRGEDLNQALAKAKEYSKSLKAPIAYASDGSTIKTLHIKTNRPLLLNGEEIDEFLDEGLALQYINANEHNTLGKQVIQSRQELIRIFSSANKELRKEGLQAGLERFSEFCNILFLKIFSEEEILRQELGEELRIPKEYNWNFFKNKDGNELLSYVNDTVLKHFQNEYGKDIFTPLQVKNPVILKRIMDKLDPLSLVDTNSDIKGDAFEYFLGAYLADQNKDLGEYFTPRHIVKTLVKLVNPKFGERVYDPFCGTGGMLIEAFKHIYNKMPRNEETLKQLKANTIYGAEITKNAKITKLNMILTGDGHNNIERTDSLKYPSERKYDTVITNMPFSLGNYGEYADNYKLGSGNGNSLCVEHCFNAIDPSSSNPRIGIVVPEGILFDQKFKKLREYIYNNSHVQNIISLPLGAFAPYAPEVKTSILYLTQVNVNKKEQESVWCFSVRNDGLTKNVKRRKKEGDNDLDIFLSYNNSEEGDKLRKVGFEKLDMEQIKDNDYISILSLYRTRETDSKFMLMSLGDLLEGCKELNRDGFEVWSVSNKEGFITPDKIFSERVASDNTEKYQVIRKDYFAYNPARINVGSIAYNASAKVGCVSPMYVVFKIKDKKILDPKYLYWLLKTKELKDRIREFAFGSVRQTVNFDDFCKIQIPLPSLDEQKNLVSKAEIKKNEIKQLEKQIEEIEKTIASDLEGVWK